MSDWRVSLIRSWKGVRIISVLVALFGLGVMVRCPLSVWTIVNAACVAVNIAIGIGATKKIRELKA